MQHTPSTSEAFDRLHLGLPIGEELARWAEVMVPAGFESDRLNVLLGGTAPFNSFEFTALLGKLRRT